MGSFGEERTSLHRNEAMKPGIDGTPVPAPDWWTQCVSYRKHIAIKAANG